MPGTMSTCNVRPRNDTSEQHPGWSYWPYWHTQLDSQLQEVFARGFIRSPGIPSIRAWHTVLMFAGHAGSLPLCGLLTFLDLSLGVPHSMFYNVTEASAARLRLGVLRSPQPLMRACTRP